MMRCPSGTASHTGLFFYGVMLQRFRQVLEMHGDRYDRADRFTKTVLAGAVVESLRRSGARFLQRDEWGGWMEIVDKSVCREKVSHGFRNRRRVLVGGSSRNGRPPIAAPEPKRSSWLSCT
jgi:hypothetical protein